MIGLVLDILLKFVDIFIINAKWKSGLRKSMEGFKKKHDKEIDKNVIIKKRYDEKLDELRRKKAGK